MSAEQGEKRPTLSQLAKEFKQADQSLGRARDLLAEPGGKSWPRFYQLGNLPTNTTNEQDEFIRRSARVADRFVPKIAEVAGRLEIKVEDLRLQVAEGRLEVIKASAERRQQGQPGLSDEVLQKARALVDELKAKRDRNLSEPPIRQKAARRVHIELEVLDGVRLRDIGGKLADVAEILDGAQGRQLTRRAIAAAAWPDMPVEQALRNLTATLKPQNQQRLHEQGVDIRPLQQKDGKSILELVRFEPTAQYEAEPATEPPQITEDTPSILPAPSSAGEEEKKEKEEENT